MTGSQPQSRGGDGQDSGSRTGCSRRGALVGQAGSPLMSGASGRLWARNDGRGRLELQSSAGDVQIVWTPKTVTVYDASSNTVYRRNLPATKTGQADKASGAPSLAAIDDFLGRFGKHVTLSAAAPSNVAGRKAYTVTASPKEKGGLLDSVQVAWDAARGVPLRAAVYAKGTSKPSRAGGDEHQLRRRARPQRRRRSLRRAREPCSFPRSRRGEAPSSDPSRRNRRPLASRSWLRGACSGFSARAIHVVGPRDSRTALVVYGEGLGAIVVAEHKGADTRRAAQGAADGSARRRDRARALRLRSATILQWRRGDVTYVLAGSIPAATAAGGSKRLEVNGPPPSRPAASSSATDASSPSTTST